MTIKNYILDKNVFPHEEGDIRVYLDENGQNVTGQIHVYYDTGEIAAIFEVEKGKKNGKYTEFYKNKNIKSKCHFLDGHEIGITKEFYETGNIQYIIDRRFELDTGVTVIREYYENGNLKYSEDNNKLRNCRIISSYDETGTLKYDFFITNKEYELKQEYYSNGKLKRKNYFIIGTNSETGAEVLIPHGLEELYYENGQIFTEREYRYGNLNGVEKQYYEDGKLKSETVYNGGEQISTKFYNKN